MNLICKEYSFLEFISLILVFVIGLYITYKLECKRISKTDLTIKDLKGGNK
jgi:hypothetical protein